MDLTTSTPGDSKQSGQETKREDHIDKGQLAYPAARVYQRFSTQKDQSDIDGDVRDMNEDTSSGPWSKDSMPTNKDREGQMSRK
ncbi:hypothetical protein N7537_012289 [Penicillium hordei]|uniref:Uncharacterized protein n=1 Tax=Penicillium hordei TaxID=40994 RepID=A0AAD6DNS1_9EURO|nr:uncharacterized protein N7537_012289 [Penicillium hordei]KAJ5589611.1 hypothetical protein N7537_012289 [Penicillium hordei]